ncbi:MAG: ABC transporter substrate-binding protein [Verrucomicrobia bacterium GWC2_42_7]|nr:MAG: ABC transporter substrate-binding protein [Verrucomicrobia bacterium GWC2_42_7]
MRRFLLRRFFVMIPMLFAISLLVFILMKLAPGDFLTQVKASKDFPPERVIEIQREFGLDKPWYVQYGLWLRQVACWDFGYSWTYRVPVSDLLFQKVPATLILALTSLSFAWFIAIPLGVLSAVYRDSVFDRLASFITYASLSIPEFFLALLAVFFAAKTGWFPTGGRTAIVHDFLSPLAQWGDIAYHLVLPTLVLGLSNVAGMMRVMRGNFLDYMTAEFVTTARAKGLSEFSVMFKHVLCNAINPLITSFGFSFSRLLSGALLVENVMNYPGLGQLIYEAFLKQDQYVVMASVMVGAFMLLLGNFLSDLLLAFTDPRIRLESK